MPRYRNYVEDEPLEDIGLISDDEGNTYTPEQVRAASEQLARDEAGEGSLGGLAEDEAGDYSTTSILPQRGPFKRTGPAPSIEEPVRAERELNPANFGDFFKSNVFGGLDARYVTGKRPMTLFDYATDVISAYGGEDLGKRNALLVDTERKRRKDILEAQLTGQRIKTSQRQEQKAGMEVEKMAGESIQRVMHDLDSDLWVKEIGAIAKEHNLTLRPGTTAMVERMAQSLAEAGATSPAEVLQNPERFDPGLVNRVRHTMSLLNKNIQESQANQLEQEKSKQALGLRPGAEQRASEETALETGGINEAIELLQEDARSTDPGVRRQALARIAALKQGGTTAQTVLAELAGVAQPRTGRNIREQRFETMAAEQLGPDATPGAIAKRAEELRVASESAVTGGRKTAGIVAEGRVQVARALQNINAIRQTAKQVLTTSALASYAQPIEFFFRRKFRDPKLSALQAIPATLSDLARALGEKGVLTDTDLERVRQALLPQETDTWDTFNARVTFVENLMREGQKALERAASTGVIEPVNSAPLGTFEGDPFPPDEAGEGKTPEGGSSKKEMARQAYEKAKTIKDPVAQRAFVEAELRRINGSVE